MSLLHMVRCFFLVIILLGFVFYSQTLIQAHGVIPACAQQIADKSAQRKITYSGGPGHSLKTAVVIAGAPNAMAGIAAEYRYLKEKFGRENVDWFLRDQSMVQQGHKVYDRLDLDLKGCRRRTTVFFDISEFFGKL